VNQLGAAVVDTDVFSLMYVRRANSDLRVAGWREYLTGRRVLISFQTRAEVLVGARSAQWGGRRMAEAIEILDRTPRSVLTTKWLTRTQSWLPSAAGSPWLTGQRAYRRSMGSCLCHRQAA